jgi:GNAT superfamily N-acetyltransferase
MKLLVKHPTKLTPYEYKQCWGLNYGKTGWLRRDLVDSRNDPNKYDKVYMIKDGPQILSWALVYEIDSAPGSLAQFWTRKEWRRQGLATKIVKRVKKDFKRVKIIPHDEISESFFSKHRRGRRANRL